MFGIIILVTGILLMLNRIAGITDEAQILTYDITAILSGLGFIFIHRQNKK
jgi:hypothetical protein